MDEHKTWQRILEIVKGQINPGNYKTWFSHTTLGGISDNLLTIKAPSAFIKGQLIARYDSLIKSSSAQILGFEPNIDYIIDPSLHQKPSGLDQEEDLSQIFKYPQSSIQAPQSPLNPKYTLENFVVGLTNNLAFAAAQAIVQNPGTSYNPLFIYGPSGVGKTHLMHAVGNEILKQKPYIKIVYAPSERFMNDLVDSIQNKKTYEFRQKYRSCDILLIDDIQFISGKDSTQEEFFHTFNELYQKNSQIILTSDRPPTEMQKLESRLLSRFQGGLMVDIQLPDFDTRMAILKAKLKERGETLPEDALKLIAESVESNTRELEGKLIQLLQTLKLNHQSPDIETVERFLGKQIAKESGNVDYKRVLSTINQYFNIKMSDIIGPRRQKELVVPRQLAMYLLYEDCHLSMERVGEILGGRDHTTILHGIEKIRGAVKRDRDIQSKLMDIKNQLSTI